MFKREKKKVKKTVSAKPSIHLRHILSKKISKLCKNTKKIIFKKIIQFFNKHVISLELPYLSLWISSFYFSLFCYNNTRTENK
jgi:hypothetical protein